jgi:hypothetical protein
VLAENWSRASSSAVGGPEEDTLLNYGSLLLEVAIASAADAVSTRPDLLHGQLSALIITFFRKCGVDAASPTQFGLQPMSLYRCVEVILRMHFFFSRKKLYTGRLARWAEASGRLRDLESLKKASDHSIN